MEKRALREVSGDDDLRVCSVGLRVVISGAIEARCYLLNSVNGESPMLSECLPCDITRPQNATTGTQIIMLPFAVASLC